AMRYGPKILFEDVNLELLPGKRYGITGANGAGKSTLLRLITGEEQAAEGNISYPRTKELGLLGQDHFRYENDTVLDVVLQGNPRLWAALHEKDQLLAKDNHTIEEGMRLGDLEEVIMNEDGYSAHAIAHELLCGIGIEQNKHHGPLSALSGGFKLRALFAQLLFSNPDILLLDEPTNHLDIISIHWLAEYLQNNFKGVLLFVSHDRDFLNTVSTHILDVDYHTITLYTGNYEQSLLTKAEEAELRAKTLAGQERKVAHLQSFIDRFGAKATKAKQAQSRQKQIDKMEMTEIKESTRAAPDFVFPIVRPSGKTVIEVKNISKSFGEHRVLHDITFTINRGEKIALIGPNGMGKSTLLKIILDKLPADTGEYKWGIETYPAYFAQDHHEMLYESQTALDWLSNQASHQTSQKIRNTLGRVLLSGDDVNKSILTLSGGESTRLLMANLMLAKENVLILDEPTNHLDLESIEALADALLVYEGTLITVSHDKYFISKVANRIFAITPHGLKDYHGTYDEYLNFYGEDFFAPSFSAVATSSIVSKEPTVQSKSNNKSSAKNGPLEKRISQCQGKIDSLEQALHEVTMAFAEPSLYEAANNAKLKSLELQKSQLQKKLEAAMQEWEKAVEANS
ncbi:MAG: ABC-F family ATP-binding cassette domain-containing protein, partial [Gammaproteobacteria bacterium]